MHISKGHNPVTKEKPGPGAVRNQLEQITKSVEFADANKISAFLTFVTEETLAGRANTLKQYTIAVNAFERQPDFDPSVDPIVRIQAGRLRRRLESYYLKEGAMDPVLIELPRGTYTPCFSLRETEDIPEEKPEKKILSDRKWDYSISVFPFHFLSASPGNEYVAEGVSEELLMELARYQHLTIYREFPTSTTEKGDISQISSSKNARFALRGTIRISGIRIKASVSLVDQATSSQVFGKAFESELEPEKLIAFQEEIAAEVARKIGDIFEGVIFKKILSESRKASFHDFQAYDSLLLFYDYQKNVAPHTFEKAFNSVQQALKIDPHFGLGYATLCNLYTDAIAVDFVEGMTSLPEALNYGKKAVALEPDSQMARAILGYCLVINGHLEESLKQFDHALALNPGASYYVGAIGWGIGLAGQGERSIQIMRRAMELNPGYPRWYHMASCFHYLRQGQFEMALAEATLFGPQELFLSPLLKAACNGLLERQEEAETNLDDLLTIKHDFPCKARYLVNMYAKLEDLQEKIMDGLRKAGLNTSQ